MKLPNLDAMSPTELAEFTKQIKSVVEYSILKEWAIYARLDGNIVRAEYLERSCEYIYNEDIPKEWRW